MLDMFYGTLPDLLPKTAYYKQADANLITFRIIYIVILFTFHLFNYLPALYHNICVGNPDGSQQLSCSLNTMADH